MSNLVCKSQLDSMTVRHSHYIVPRGRFQTEYEAAYKWPPAGYYHQGKNHGGPGKRHVTITSADEETSTDAPPMPNWERLMEVRQELVDKGFEKHLLERLKDPVRAHGLYANIEFMYNHFLDLLEADTKPRRSRNVVKLSKEVAALGSEFIALVDRIKSC